MGRLTRRLFGATATDKGNTGVDNDNRSKTISDDVPSSGTFTRRVNNSGDMRKVFDQYDANRDGRISLAELQSVLGSLGCADHDAESMMVAADTDGDGFISFEEFLSANTTGASSARCLEDLREAFSVYDSDRDGFISAEELHRVLRSMGDQGVSMAACKSMIQSVDKNGDGAINFEEFMNMMTRPKPASVN